MQKSQVKEQPLTLDEISEKLAHDVYVAAHWFERAEGVGLIHGNGHHMAQNLATIAITMLKAAARG